MKRFLKITLLTAAALGVTLCASAQHVLSVTGGAGMTSGRFYPKQEMRSQWGALTAGVSWRHYTKERFLGGFGVDVEWMQRGFSFVPYSYLYEDKKQYKYYDREINTIMVPIVWQPHVYLFKRHVRVYIEAAATFCYNFESTFRNDYTGTSGKYHFKSVRDNRFGFGLAGGGGLDVLVGQVEFGVRARYYFGYSDILRNRNKYYDNALDETIRKGENPFYLTPLRSPLDNLNIVLRVGFRFKKEGFDEWNNRRKKRDRKAVMKFSLD